jgi:diaminohydroxyphosphoribosylaminopyrimidine deaminase/5-amino-6-(5-phosphoribosylamino)uracil reductase
MEKYMRKALALAAEYSGFTSPNPAVGAVIVKDDEIIATGAHQRAGDSHAEAIALEKAGAAAEGATLYVNLEPCNHYGKTPPCTKKIISAKIAKVVCAMQDPNPLVAGNGIAALKKANIEVVENVLKKEAEILNEYFCKSITQNEPFVILKSAITLDGKISTSTGNAKWISNPQSREETHKLRNSVDAILVGKNTFLLDNPKLDVRLKYPVSSPYKIIISNNIINVEIIKNSNAYSKNTDKPLIVAINETSLLKNPNYLESKIPNLLIIGFKTIENLLTKLYSLGIQSLLLEGGEGVYTSFLQADKVDKIVLFQAPKVIGNDGKSWVGNMGIKNVPDALEFRLADIKKLDGDLMITLYPKLRQ